MRIVFTGDVSFTGSFKDALDNNKTIFDHNVEEFLSNSDFSIVNLEGPATKKESLRTDINVINHPSSIDYLSTKGINGFNLANNHIFDAGIKGFDETIKKIKTNDCFYLGVKESGNDICCKILTIDNVKVAVISVSKLFPSMNTDECKTNISLYSKSKIKHKINSVRSLVDWVVIMYHGGEEYTILPWPQKRKLFLEFLDFGCDIVVSHHSHTIQPYEKINNKYIFHSLGNFIFDISTHKSKSYINDGVILALNFNKDKFDFDYIGVNINSTRSLVSLSNVDELFYDMSTLPHYYKKWNNECLRVFSERNKINSKSNFSNNKYKSVFFRKVVNVMKNDEFRAIVKGMLISKFSTIIKRFK